MGLFDFFKRSVRRYAIVIALVGSLSSACNKGLPKNEATALSALANQVEQSLKEEHPDKEKIIEFVKFVAKAKKEYGLVLPYNAPENLLSAVSALSLFYDQVDKDNTSLNAPVKRIDWGSSRIQFIVVNYSIASHLSLLFEAEKQLGTKLDEERNSLKVQINLMLKYVEEELGRLQRGEFKSGNPRYKKALEDTRESFLEALRKLEK